MKKIFTFLAMAFAVTTAFAQSAVYRELGYADIPGINSDDKVDVAANTALGADGYGNVFSTAFDDQVKLVSVTCSGYNTICVNGTDYSIAGGYQGNNNPKDEDGTGVAVAMKTPASGSVLKITANKDGYMYVIGKFSNNKQYCVFEDDQPIGYEIVIDGTAAAADTLGNSTVATAVKATVVGDDAEAQYWVTTPVAKLGILNGLGSSAANNGAGFIKFAVAKGCTYLVCASGSKLTQCGTIFSETGEESIYLKGTNVDTGDVLRNVTLEGETASEPVTGVGLECDNTKLLVNDKTYLKLTIYPDFATNQEVTWTSSDEEVATVDENGKVTAIAEGAATITVTTADGGFTATCDITVNSSSDVSGIYNEFEYTYITDYATYMSGEKFDVPAGAYLGTDAAGNTFTTAFDDQIHYAAVECNGYHTICVNGIDYSITGGYQGSNNPKDEDGTGVAVAMKAPASGSVLQIKAAHDGYMYVIGKFSNNKQYCVFEDGSAIGYDIVIDGTAAAVDTLGNSTVAKAMTATVIGDDADNYYVTNSVAKLGILNGLGASAANNGAGFIKFQVNGGCTYLVSASGSKLTQCGTIFSETGEESIILKGTNADTQEALSDVVLEEVSTPVPVTGVALDYSNLTVNIGENTSLISTIYPTNATQRGVKWTSSDESVATVSSNGVVSAIAEGTAVISVTTADGGFTANCNVTVTPIHVTYIALNYNNLGLKSNRKFSLTSTIYPSDASNQEITWTSSDESVATVNSDGLVTAISVGTAIITATTVDGGYSASCYISVTEGTPTTSGTGVYTELDYASIEGINSDDKVDAAANTALGSDSYGNVFSTAFDDQVKLVGVTCSGYNTICVNGTDYSIAGGYQGNNNPKDEDGTGVAVSMKAPTQGSVLQITAAHDGYMYVIGKFSNNKQYCVFEDDQPIGYEIVIDGTAAATDTLGNSTVATAVKATVAGDDAEFQYYVTNSVAKLGMLNGLGSSAANNGAGFIKFAVAKGATYLVCASGSKLTQCGTIFSETGEESIILKGTNADTLEDLDDVVLEEVITTAISEVAAESTTDVVKTIVNGKLVIMKNGKTYSVTGATIK